MPSSSSGSSLGCGFGWLARMWGSVAAVLMMLFGIFNIPSCLSWAVYMMCVGFFALLIEGSCVASMFGAKECGNQVSALLKHWHKAGLYLLISLPPLVMCFGFRTLLGAGALFSVGGVYFVLALGGKGAGNDMIVKAQRGEDKEMRVQLMEDTDDAPPVPAKEPVSGSVATPEAAVSKSEPSPAPKPAFTGSLPMNVPPAFPDGFGERTIPFTGPVPKLVSSQPAMTIPAVTKTHTSVAMGPHTIPFTGTLKPVPANSPLPPPSAVSKP